LRLVSDLLRLQLVRLALSSSGVVSPPCAVHTTSTLIPGRIYVGRLVNMTQRLRRNHRRD